MPRNTKPGTRIHWDMVGVALLQCILGVICVASGVWGTPVIGFSIVLIALGVGLVVAGAFTFRLGRSVDPDYVTPQEQEARLAFNWQERLYPIGPDLAHDIRLGRPYFLLCVGQHPGRTGRSVPLNVEEARELAFAGDVCGTDPELARALGRVKRWATAHDAGGGSFTDVYVLCHGWHRNLYGSVAAYDRLISRWQSLQRSMLRLPDKYRPLFLAVHWHSDPGENQWRDSSGCRSKASFMQNVRATFEGGDGTFERDFEDLYELFATMSKGLSPEQTEERTPVDVLAQRIREILRTSPDLREGEAQALRDVLPILRKRVDPLADHARPVFDRLRDPIRQYRLKSATPGFPEPWTVDHTAAAWACYHAAPRDPDHDRRTGGLIDMLRTLSRPAIVLAFVTVALFMLMLTLADVPRLLPSWLLTHFQSQSDVWAARADPVVSVLLPTAWLLVTYGFNYASDRRTHVPARHTDPDAVPDSGDEERQQQMISQRRDRLVAPVVLLLYGVVMTYFAVLGMFYSPTATGSLTAFVTCAALYLTGGGIAQKVRSARDDKGELLTNRSWGERLRNVPVALFAIPPLQIATWTFVQSVFSLPLLLYTVGTRLLGAVFTCRGRSEKCLRPDRAHRSVDMRPKRLLSVIAALPINLARTALPVDSRFQLLLDTVEAQLAFWRMQRRAVETGVTTARALARLIGASGGIESARIHFLGHSFGGLAAANAARQFMSEAVQDTTLTATMESLTLLLPAMADHWFDQEQDLRKAIRGTIACLHSRQDTANGFFYPLANHGQRSAGFNGLADIQSVEGSTTAGAFPRTINRDLSDVCCTGSMLAGRGHGDIFKDDVLFAIWEEITARSVAAGHGRTESPSQRIDRPSR